MKKYQIFLDSVAFFCYPVFAMNIGEKIRRLRRAKKITLKELAGRSGVAVATLSRIETKKMTGTVKSHQAIASVLGITLPELYGEMEVEEKAVVFQSRQNRTDTFVHNDKASYHILTSSVLSKKMMPMIIRLAPGGRTVEEALPKQTEKFVYIMRGKCIIYIDTKGYNLREAETLYFDASLKHHFKNSGDSEMRAVCVISPPAL